jgi:RNA polymerase sigma-70 factor (ECF subfamily)
MKAELTDEQLMLNYSKGDIAAFELLYTKHKGGLFRYCSRQFINKAIGEECFQEIWLKVINSRARYQPTALFTTYLYRVAQNHVVDTFRKEKKRQADCEYVEESANASLVVNSGDNDSFISELRRSELRKKITLLPFEQRNTLLLKLDTGLSIEEISVILNCGKETVKSRLRYANNKLKELLKEPLGVDENG